MIIPLDSVFLQYLDPQTVYQYNDQVADVPMPYQQIFVSSVLVPANS